jgi:hypothetical protein
MSLFPDDDLAPADARGGVALCVQHQDLGMDLERRDALLNCEVAAADQ